MQVVPITAAHLLVTDVTPSPAREAREAREAIGAVGARIVDA